jgi:hypothetical protein
MLSGAWRPLIPALIGQLKALKSIDKPKGIYLYDCAEADVSTPAYLVSGKSPRLNGHPSRSKLEENASEGIDMPAGDVVLIYEDGLRYEVRPHLPRSCGLPLHQRAARKYLRNVGLAGADGSASHAFTDVLHVFSHTGSLSLPLAARLSKGGPDSGKGGASVHLVEQSLTYQQWAKRNLALNELPRGKLQVRLPQEDVWAALRRFEIQEQEEGSVGDAGGLFDLVLLDPGRRSAASAFASAVSSRSPLKKLRAGVSFAGTMRSSYRRLVGACAKALRPGGRLLAALPAGAAPAALWEEALQAGMEDAELSLVQRAIINPDVDFLPPPVLPAQAAQQPEASASTPRDTETGSAENTQRSTAILRTTKDKEEVGNERPAPSAASTMPAPHEDGPCFPSAPRPDSFWRAVVLQRPLSG